MRIQRSRFAAGLLTIVLLASGCTSTIAGEAIKIGTADGTSSGQPVAEGPTGLKAGVATADIKVTGDAHTDSDNLAKDTIADLYAFYKEVFPADFKMDFVPAKELLSYDSNDKNATACGRKLYQEVNASYNPPCDTIIWDRGVLLPKMTKETGQLAAPTVLSHEMGHLVQNRLKLSESSSSILFEQQADCYAGAYWHWVADGHSTYFDLNQTGFREVLSAILGTGDPVGLTATADQAHGSAFDRAFAFSLGYNNGPVRCNAINQAEVDKRITETGFTVIPKNYGNVEITDQLLNSIATVVNSFFGEQIKGYQAPKLVPFDGTTGPDCNGTPGTFPVSYCQASNTVGYNLKELQRIGTATDGFKSTNGDFSAIILLVSRYGLAAEATGGAAITGNQAGLRALCYAGSWAGWMRKPQGSENLLLSPNDLNKAVYQVLATPLAASDATGATTTTVVDQVQALYIGVVYGSGQCYDFYA